MINLKCVICGKTEPSTIQIKDWICSKCMKEEKEREQNFHLEEEQDERFQKEKDEEIEADNMRAYGNSLQDWIK